MASKGSDAEQRNAGSDHQRAATSYVLERAVERGRPEPAVGPPHAVAVPPVAVPPVAVPPVAVPSVAVPSVGPPEATPDTIPDAMPTDMPNGMPTTDTPNDMPTTDMPMPTTDMHDAMPTTGMPTSDVPDGVSDEVTDGVSDGVTDGMSDGVSDRVRGMPFASALASLFSHNTQEKTMSWRGGKLPGPLRLSRLVRFGGQFEGIDAVAPATTEAEPFIGDASQHAPQPLMSKSASTPARITSKWVVNLLPPVWTSSRTAPVANVKARSWIR